MAVQVLPFQEFTLKISMFYVIHQGYVSNKLSFTPIHSDLLLR